MRLLRKEIFFVKVSFLDLSYTPKSRDILIMTSNQTGSIARQPGNAPVYSSTKRLKRKGHVNNPDNLMFGDRMDRAVREKKSVAVVGIDPTPAMFPPDLAKMAASGSQGMSAALSEYCLGIVNSVADVVPAIKPNIAFFEAFGMHGFPVYKSICIAADSAGLLVIGDVKRGDIGSTAAAYAAGLLDAPKVDLAHLGGISNPGDFEQSVGALLGPHDALTLNPYLGSDSVKPFTDRGLARGQGFFVLVKTSNPSSAEIQDMELASGGTVAEHVANLFDSMS